MPMKKLILSLAFCILISIFFVNACECSETEDPLTALEEYDAVFQGKVIQIRGLFSWDRLIKLEVLKSWKGNLGTSVDVVSHQEETKCGFNFEIGKKYIIYANYESNRLRVTKCSRTKLLVDAKEEVSILNNQNKFFNFRKFLYIILSWLWIEDEENNRQKEYSYNLINNKPSEPQKNLKEPTPEF